MSREEMEWNGMDGMALEGCGFCTVFGCVVLCCIIRIFKKAGRRMDGE